MRARSVLAVVIALTVAGVCVRLGLWQHSRWQEKRALNAALRHALAAPPMPIGHGGPRPGGAPRRVRLVGRFDETRQLLLSARSQNHGPGVEVVTPLVLADGSAVLVNRGWLFAADAVTARPQDYPEPGERTVVGLDAPLARGLGGAPPRAIEADSVRLWSVRWLDRDSLAPRFPYALAPFAVRELPGAGVPPQPARTAPRPYDETMHVSYMIQWFLFAGIALFGPAAYTWTRRRAATGGESDLVIPGSQPRRISP